MFFCENCHYMYNITKDIRNKQAGGAVSKSLDNLFNKFSKREQIIEKDLDDINGTQIKEDERYENMTKNDRKKLESAVKAAVGPSKKNFFTAPAEKEGKIGNNNAYFICKSCKHTKAILPGTMIYSRNYVTNDIDENRDYEFAIYDQTLTRTKNYNCHNENCNSHVNIDEKEAVMTKDNSGHVVYVCVLCKTSWTS